ncbi:MAG: hypothetical protein GWO41_02025, partial [candidate division Zixibacteria bacterium]|nr:hypothetical protein [candidate division Zixibacteria bacterium]NIR62391.1 hypothetical protein [candidate division Zixibacteria bacterium]NIS15034.1 hypothetical protein [candidate division Zixibacteria bacterium]NIS44568.1 hypothetical protein [candidate division Zixibacteria bacterium]NIT51546.1 hypothetical protein [candidate division Zixibacteria bacterium]
TEEKAPKKIKQTEEEIERERLEAQGQTKIEMPGGKTWTPYGVGTLKEKIYPKDEALALLDSLRQKHGNLEFRMIESQPGDWV